MYPAIHEGEPPTGDLHPHTHAHAGRTPLVPPHRRPLATLKTPNGYVWAARGDRER